MDDEIRPPDDTGQQEIAADAKGASEAKVARDVAGFQIGDGKVVSALEEELKDIPKLKLAAGAKDSQKSPVSPRLQGGSPRLTDGVLSPRLSARMQHEQAMQARLFGGSAPKQADSSNKRSPQARAEAQARIQAPKKQAVLPADPELTFRPVISKASQSLAADRYANGQAAGADSLAAINEEKKAEMERKRQEREELELTECTFAPCMPGLAKYHTVEAKFLDSGYERYQKKKPENASWLSKAKASPKKDAKVKPPSTPKDLESCSGATKHVERSRAAWDDRMALQKKLQLLGVAKEKAWEARDKRRGTTTPVPFCSHTGLRKHMRKKHEEEQVLQRIEGAKELFQELHDQLHGLDLGGPSS